MKTNLFLTLIMSCLMFTFSQAQSVEIQGQAKVTDMSNDNSVDELVVRKSDGTLATRSAQSLPSSFVDTTRSLSSDLELAKHLCDCPNLPPFLVQSLMDSGYTAQDLVAAGVNIQDVLAVAKVYDIDGNEYSTVTIGSQTWLASNLKVTQFNDGTNLDLVTDNDLWDDAYNDKEAAYCYPNGNASNLDEYGLIYNIYAVPFNSGKNICPLGYHVPKKSEVETLLAELEPGSTNFTNTAGAILKETGTDHWNNPNLANNLSGLGLRAAGARYANAPTNFTGFKTRSYLLTDSFNGNASNPWWIYAQYNTTNLVFAPFPDSLTSAPIRCVKD